MVAMMVCQQRGACSWLPVAKQSRAGRFQQGLGEGGRVHHTDRPIRNVGLREVRDDMIGLWPQALFRRQVAYDVAPLVVLMVHHEAELPASLLGHRQNIPFPGRHDDHDAEERQAEFGDVRRRHDLRQALHGLVETLLPTEANQYSQGSNHLLQAEIHLLRTVTALRVQVVLSIVDRDSNLSRAVRFLDFVKAGFRFVLFIGAQLPVFQHPGAAVLQHHAGFAFVGPLLGDEL
mmetsp:Transcript_22476/g.63249  ORF Transcript_22476/g.63249 Transcript_22476/m.63249 type:complete len:233 (+) Transcript_22476:464-1162(+)